MKKFWNSEKIIGMVAGCISLGTFFLFIYQTQLMREHQRATLLPYLELSYVQTPNSFTLILENNGIGPAFVNEIKIRYKDSFSLGTPYDYFKRKIAQSDSSMSMQFTHSEIGKGTLIPAGETISLIASDCKTGRNYLHTLFVKEPARTEITYSSIYKETWITKGFNPPVQIED